MNCPVRLLILIALLIGPLAAPLPATAAPPVPNHPPAAVEAEPMIDPCEIIMRWIPREVRLRKLHLVRPDLIPYPIAYQVYC